jgi:SpoVK/Ycf46/Vps4 family AAA+-type ATPase
VLPRIHDDPSQNAPRGAEVDALLVGGHALSPDAQAEVAKLDAALATWDERIEGGLEASRAADRPLPWDHLRRAFSLTPTEQRALLVLAAVEVSARHRQIARYLVNDPARVHFDVRLLDLAVYRAEADRERLIVELAVDGTLLRHRLVEVPTGGSRRAAEEYPFLLRPLRVAPRVVELLHGRTTLDREIAGVASLLAPARGAAEWVGPPATVEQLRGLLRESLTTSSGGTAPQALVLVGPEGVGKRHLAAALAHEIGLATLSVNVRALPDERDEIERTGRAIAREALLFRAVPVLVGIDAVAEDPRGPSRLAALDAALADFRGPLVATNTQRDGRTPSLGRGAIRVDVELPSEGERVEIWYRSFVAQQGAGESVALDEALDVERIAARYPITGGLIERAAQSAAALARARGDGVVTERDAHDGLRVVLDEKMSTLGTRITRRQRWEDLVLPPETLDGVREFIARIRHRRLVYEQWGFARKLAKGLGVSALFAGPPGTGKTMVAGLCAEELALDLYQIDLSRIVSKYIGETEKNLAQVFDAAEAGHAILLFDEADSLFAKRTEVKTSVDRYANLEVNYLLQRMERFDGVTILTTNLESSIDAAFKRRLAFRLDFPFPQTDERARLWQVMIPAEAEVEGDLAFDQLASTYEMSGGNIRNAVLRAAFLAAGEGSPMTMEHLRRAGDLEYSQMGKVFTTARPE